MTITGGKLIVKSLHYGISYLKTSSSDEKTATGSSFLEYTYTGGSYEYSTVLHKDKCYGSHELVALTAEYTQEGQKT
jgi:hypothetical protein